MNRDGFLARWSRRKRELATLPVAASARDTEPAPTAAGGVATTDCVPNDDLAERLRSLPLIEAITANQDVAPFMQAWVPDELRNRAMRRMWSLDPAIRDFVAPESERYDFDKPGTMFSHGPINLDADELKAMAERMFGGGSPGDEAPAASAGLPDREAERDVSDVGDPAVAASDPSEINVVSAVHADRSLALDGAPSPATPSASRRRRHGGARPT